MKTTVKTQSAKLGEGVTKKDLFIALLIVATPIILAKIGFMTGLIHDMPWIK